jgi:hypothetical protein
MNEKNKGAYVKVIYHDGRQENLNTNRKIEPSPTQPILAIVLTRCPPN